jgi:nicotinamidase/pyrazinamidase
VSKGADPGRDAFSGFDGTSLDAALRSAGVKRLFVGGLAAEYCVLQTVLDAIDLGYVVHLLDDATSGLDAEQSGRARAGMIARGAVPTTLEAVARA